jgi:hypothetical protein
MNDLDLLLHQTRHVYGWLTSATADVNFDAARRTLGGRPSIAWLTGHMLVNADATAAAVAGALRNVEERGSLAHWGCEAADEWEALRREWVARSVTWLATLEALAPEDLDHAPLVEVLPDFAGKLQDRRRFWSGHIFHMGYHLGQLGSLRAELGLGWWTS